MSVLSSITRRDRAPTPTLEHEGQLRVARSLSVNKNRATLSTLTQGKISLWPTIAGSAALPCAVSKTLTLHESEPCVGFETHDRYAGVG
jgi:hypothetical protein